jgi:hypothetical protein
MTNHLSKLICNIILGTSMVACAQKQVPIEDNLNEKAAAYAVTRTFISEFSQLHMKEILDLSTFPFFAEGEIFRSPAELQAKIAEDFESAEPVKIEILAMRLYSLEDIRLWKPELYSTLLEKGFVNHYLIVAELKIDKDTDSGFILLQRDEQGQWKIAGVDN